MKKIVCLSLILMMALSLFACTEPQTPAGNPNDKDTTTKSEGVMTWAEYVAAENGAAVVIEAYVQGNQSWWNGAMKVYAQDGVGGYFIWDLPCTEEESKKLTPGTKIRVSGYKATYDGEVEITDATYEIIDGYYVAEAVDVTAKLSSADLINYMNMKVAFKELTFVSLEYKGGKPGDDIYVKFSYNGNHYDFCVEVYLTGTDTDVYKTVQNLKAGDIVDIEGFAYWYLENINTHITSVTVK